ncbi:MAG: hypothetical protein J1F33_01850 [Clostridiales bacterium]|nr:hypothetical protein [Clostridiales bacterium]
MKKLRLNVFGKSNLSLNITGKKERFHTLDSVMMSVDAFDTVTVCERSDDKIEVTFDTPGIDKVNNTAYKAAKLVCDKIGRGVDIQIEKGIPVGAGLGGSSADGAAVIRALDLFYGLSSHGIDIRKTALSVGSDVPFMLTGGLAQVTAMGEEMLFIENKLKLFAVGLMTETVSTAEAYALFDTLHPTMEYLPTETDKFVNLLLDGDIKALEYMDNALFEASAKLAPSVKTNFDKLKAAGAIPCMTGSGGMVLGYYTDIDAFARAALSFKTEKGFRVFSSAPTGILHEWIER